MSRLIGAPGERWQLRRAVDALGAAARAAGRPSALWFAAATYPSISTSIEVIDWFNGALSTVDLQLYGDDVQLRESLFDKHPLLILLAPFILRFIVGLAGICGPGQLEPGRRRRLTLSRAWQAGQGLALSAFGVVFCVQLLIVTAAFALVGPVMAAAELFSVSAVDGPFLLLLLPIVLLIFAYGVCLQVMTQLALHSLASNRRGAASALTHAWRLIRHSPWATVRAGVVDVLLSVTVGAFVFAVRRVLPGTDEGTLGVLASVAIGFAIGFEGITRAGYWGRCYRELGGLAPVDGVPGLAAR